MASNPGGQGLALNLIAVCRTEIGEPAVALPIVEQALALLDRRGEVAIRDTLCSVRQALGQHAAAIAALRCAAELREQVGDRYQQTQILVRLGRVQTDAGESKGAGDASRTASTLLTDMGHPDAESVDALPATAT